METIVIAFIAIVAVIIVVSNVMGRGKPGRGNDMRRAAATASPTMQAATRAAGTAAATSLRT